jgi:membrane protein DedA with SNARE-associated domain
MDVESLKASFLAFVHANQAWAPFIVGTLAMGESLAVVSLFVPATVLLFGIGALIQTTGLPFWPIWLGAAIGAALGDWISYEVGRYFEDRAHGVWPLNRYQALVRKGEEFCRRWGVWAIVIGRFFGPARAFVPLVAGIFEMPRGPFQLANFGSAFVWAYLLLTVGDVSGEMLGKVLDHINR